MSNPVGDLVAALRGCVTWTRQPDGSYIEVGATDSRHVHILIRTEGVWSKPMAAFRRGRALDVIRMAIAEKRVKAEAYRLIPAKDGAPMPEEAKARLRAHDFEQSNPNQESAMAKKGKKEKKPRTPRVGGTATPKTNKEPALALYAAGGFSMVSSYKGGTFTASVATDGLITLDGKEYHSPSAAAMAVTGKPTNGWTFWEVELNGKLVALDTLRGKKSPLAKTAAA
jgi:hypothetical protein